MRIFKVIVLFCLALACVLVAASPKSRAAFGSVEGDALIPIDISPRWQPGSRYVLRMEFDQDASVPSPASSRRSIQHDRMSHEYTLLTLPARSDGGRELQLDLTAEKLVLVTNNQVAIDFDSRRPGREESGGVLAKMLRRLAASSLRVSIGQTGQTPAVVDYSGYMDRITANCPLRYQNLMQDVYSQDTLEQLIPNQALANRKVKVGDTWLVPSRIVMPSQGISLPIGLHCVFRGWDELSSQKFARLEFAGNLPAKYDNLGIENLRLDGQAWYDPMKGIVVESVARTVCNLHETPDAQKIPSLIVQTITQKLLTIVPPARDANNPR